jgi:hypothetical protein
LRCSLPILTKSSRKHLPQLKQRELIALNDHLAIERVDSSALPSIVTARLDARMLPPSEKESLQNGSASL